MTQVPAQSVEPSDEPAAEGPAARLQRRIRQLTPLIAVAIAVIAILALHRELTTYHYRDVVRALHAIPRHAIALAVGFTAAGYAALVCYDAIALAYVRSSLKAHRIAFTSFIAYAFSQTLGFPLLTGGSIRYRLYTAWGLSSIEIAQAVAFTSLSFWVGVLTIAGGVFLLEPAEVAHFLHLPIVATQLVGLVLLGLVAGYLVFSGVRHHPLRLFGTVLPAPSLRLAAIQLAVSCVDWAFAGAVLYSLLPNAARVSFPAFLGLFLLAQVVGFLSHVPGGLGVFDTVILLLLAPTAAAGSEVLGALVAYRVIYYLLPFGVAAALMGGYELARRSAPLARASRVAGNWAPTVMPQVLAGATFIAGALLLFSGATPEETSRLRWLYAALPLAVIEASHFIGSVAGVGLLVLARGLQRRLDAAWHVGVVLLSVGIAASLLKGLDYEEAIVLAIVLGVLVASRGEFYRRAALLSEPFSAGWIIAIGLVVLASVWLGLFAYQHVAYRGDLWWRFALHGNAPRFLRATVGAMMAVGLIAAMRLFRPAPPDPSLPGPEELRRAEAVVADSATTRANLALLGDKSLLFSGSGRSFVMYGVEGRSWVALGDPVGPPEEREEMVWAFRELVGRHGGWTVFYEVERETLYLYLDLGLSLLKLGEEARVPLAEFSLDGGGRKGLRRTLRQVEKDGATFEVAPPDGVSALLPELTAVSDAWLARKRTREKGFSLGRFDPGYLARFPLGLVRLDGRIVAFANIWRSAGQAELSVDLMRFRPEAPAGVMEYLFIRLMLWGREQGFTWFDLGMAPLAGLENRALAPLWARLGALVFRHGEHFYNFQGLRDYKEKFDPVWVPRYLAAPGGLALPGVVTNLATLISGGVRGVVAR